MIEKKEMNNLLNNLILYFNHASSENYPWSVVILGLGYMEVQSQQEMFGRISMLAELLGIPYQLKNIDGLRKKIILGGKE